MLHLSNLLFPSLVRKNETTFKALSNPSMTKTTTVYSLDWSKIDEIKQIRFKEDKLDVFPGTLPQEYDIWVKERLFSIPIHYLDEIRNSARKAALEWNTERRFDTLIRDICLEPAISYVYKAFRLLADCSYDQKTNYYDRSNNKCFLHHAMLYKFWVFQTSRGELAYDYSKIKSLENWVTEHEEDIDTPIIRKFISALNDYHTNILFPLSLNDSEKINFSTLVSEKDLDSTRADLKRLWADNRGIMNISYGNIKGISPFLKEIIRKYREKAPQDYGIILLIKNKSYVKEYKNLLEGNVVDDIQHQCSETDPHLISVLGKKHIPNRKGYIVFSEGIKEIGKVMKFMTPSHIYTSKKGVLYITGFYGEDAY